MESIRFGLERGVELNIIDILLFILLKLLSFSFILFLSQNLSCNTEAKFVRPESLFFFVRLHHEIRALLSSKVDSYDAARIS